VDGGTYTLVIERHSDGPIEVGALGHIDFPAGGYAYTGSALGPGGFSRVERHRAVASGENDARHWHVDYLLGDDTTSVETAVTTAGDIECVVARRLVDAVGGTVPDFGCSDCDCPSHLVGCADRAELVATVERIHAGETGAQEGASGTE
jgi:endonuclease-3